MGNETREVSYHPKTLRKKAVNYKHASVHVHTDLFSISSRNNRLITLIIPRTEDYGIAAALHFSSQKQLRLRAEQKVEIETVMGSDNKSIQTFILMISCSNSLHFFNVFDASHFYAFSLRSSVH